MPRTPRKPADLSPSFHQRLNSYALAASAAGVGILALASPVDAKVVYTPDHRHVPLNGKVYIDLNRDGVADFYIRGRSGVFTTGSGSRISATSLFAKGSRMGNRIAGYQTFTTEGIFSFASVLSAGQSISSHRLRLIYGLLPMAARQRVAGRGKWRCDGPWKNVRNRYLGLQFVIKGKSHYGWARLNESCTVKPPRGKGLKALLTGYAYETIPNKPIIAGKTKGPDVITLEPGSLGRLAQGSAGRLGK